MSHFAVNTSSYNSTSTMGATSRRAVQFKLLHSNLTHSHLLFLLKKQANSRQKAEAGEESTKNKIFFFLKPVKHMANFFTLTFYPSSTFKNSDP